MATCVRRSGCDISSEGTAVLELGVRLVKEQNVISGVFLFHRFTNIFRVVFDGFLAVCYFLTRLVLCLTWRWEVSLLQALQ